MTERLQVLENMRDTVILELGLIATVGLDNEMFSDAHDDKLNELRQITGELIEVKDKQDE